MHCILFTRIAAATPEHTAGTLLWPLYIQVIRGTSPAPEERKALRELIAWYIEMEQPALEFAKRRHDAHQPGLLLLWQRPWLTQLEFWLQKQGDDRFVPLPFWHLAKPIQRNARLGVVEAPM